MLNAGVVFCFVFEVSLANQKLRFKPARMQSFGGMPWVCWMICTSRLGVAGVDQGSDRSRDLERSDPCVNVLGGGFKYCLFPPLFGEDSHFD